MMDIGALRHRITIEAPPGPNAAPQDGFGTPRPAYTTVATVWGEVEPLNGREFFASQSMDAETTHRIRLRYTAGLTARHRLRFGQRIFEITSPIVPQERGEELVLMCVERAA